jgi:hypothetical protein
MDLWCTDGKFICLDVAPFNVVSMTQLSRLTKIGLAVLGAALIVWLVITLAFTGSTQKTGAVPVDDKHCPKCGLALPRGGLARECPYCFLANREQGVMAVKSSSPAVPIVIVSLIVLLVGANIFANVRSRRKERKDETYFVYQCAKCSRRIRYREAQFRKPALCPLCKRPFVFPQPYDPHLGRWMRMKRWLKLAPRSVGLL